MHFFVLGMNMKLNNKDDIDPLVTLAINVDTKINDIQDNIQKKLRPTLVQLNEEGEPILAKAQEKSMKSTKNK